MSDTRLVFGSPVAGAAGWILDFEGSFECQAVEGGTEVAHREAFRFKHPWRLLARLLLGKWLATDTAREMVRLKGLIEDGETRRGGERMSGTTRSS